MKPIRTTVTIESVKAAPGLLSEYKTVDLIVRNAMGRSMLAFVCEAESAKELEGAVGAKVTLTLEGA